MTVSKYKIASPIYQLTKGKVKLSCYYFLIGCRLGGFISQRASYLAGTVDCPEQFFLGRICPLCSFLSNLIVVWGVCVCVEGAV